MASSAVRRTVLGVALFALAAAAVAGSSQLPGRTARTVGDVSAVNASAYSALDVRGYNSPRLVADPTNPANLALASRIDTPRFSCGLHLSSDGGSTWREASVPFPDSDTVRCFGPDVAYSGDGTLHFAFTSFARLEGLGTVPDAVWLSSSRDKGATMSAPAQVSGPLAFQLRLVADPSDPLRLFLARLQVSAANGFGFSSVGNPVVVTRSDDGGATWAAPVTVTPPARQRVVAPSLAVGGGGEVYVAYLDVGEDALDYAGAHEGRGGEPYQGPWSLVVGRSSDHGVTWSESTVEARLVPAHRFVQLFPPAPSLAVSGGRKPRVYAGFHDSRLGDPDVWVWTSSDGARTWSPARRVNDTATEDGTSQYLAQLAASPGGRLDVVYYDRRADRDDVMNQVSLQSSYDGGRTYSARLHLADRPFDSRVGFGSDRDLPDLGDRHGLLATDRRALVVWTDTRQGTPATGKQDLARVLVAFSPASALRQPLQWAGLATGVSGIAVIASGVARWRRRRRSNRRDRPSSADKPVPVAAPDH